MPDPFILPDGTMGTATLCTCGVVSGGERDPNPCCELHPAQPVRSERERVMNESDLERALGLMVAWYRPMWMTWGEKRRVYQEAKAVLETVRSRRAYNQDVARRIDALVSAQVGQPAQSEEERS